jgi:NADPH:quinone reductase
MKAKAIRIRKAGGPDAMVYEDVEVGAPGPGEVLLRQTAIGVNYIDVYQRDGTYPLPALPGIIGMEAVGIVEAIGEGVSGLKKGARVGYAAGPAGAYTSARVMKAQSLVELPRDIPDEIGASIMLQGMTARYLVRQTYRVKKGDFVLVHAAAGGMGLLLCQWCAFLGATVIGTTSTPEKAALAKANGCHYPILYTKTDFAAEVKTITGGKGVAVVYDGVGKDTFLKSLEALAPRGMMVLYGAASGAPDPIAPAILAPKCLFLTRPTLFVYTAQRRELVANAREVFKMVVSGALKIKPPARYKLSDAAKAHTDLTSRKTTGSLVLIP